MFFEVVNLEAIETFLDLVGNLGILPRCLSLRSQLQKVMFISLEV